jgi:hypothetical protein
MDDIRAQLDALMGQDRNVPLSERDKYRHVSVLRADQRKAANRAACLSWRSRRHVLLVRRATAAQVPSCCSFFVQKGAQVQRRRYLQVLHLRFLSLRGVQVGAQNLVADSAGALRFAGRSTVP